MTTLEQDIGREIARAEELSRSGDRAAALVAARDVVERDELDAAQLTRIARIGYQLREPALERRALELALASGKLETRQQRRLIDLCIALGDPRSAVRFAERLRAAEPGDEGHVLALASCLAGLGRNDDARHVLETWMETHRPSDDCLLAWGSGLTAGLAIERDVIARLNERVPPSETSWLWHYLSGRAYAALNENDHALRHLGQAARLAPDISRTWRELGLLQRRLGARGDSQDSLRRALQLEPGDVETLRLMGYDHVHRAGDFNFDLITRALADARDYSPAAQVDLHYAAAKAFEDIGDPDTAFAHFRRAGEIERSLLSWSIADFEMLAEVTRAELSAPAYRALRAQGYADERPVFVIGMPRSGTTLVEQILGSHPEVFAAGELNLGENVLAGMKAGRLELPNIIRPSDQATSSANRHSLAARGGRYANTVAAVAPAHARRIVDKLPGNFLYAGWLSAILPGARFIHCRRHPMDCCLSLFKTHFGPAIPYSYDLDDLARAYRAYDGIMRHWSDILPPETLTSIRYEDLVMDLEAQGRRLLSFLGLTWNDACLNFSETPRQIRTASATQVREPVHARSIGAWRKYERHLSPLREALDDLVTDYERNCPVTRLRDVGS